MEFLFDKRNVKRGSEKEGIKKQEFRIKEGWIKTRRKMAPALLTNYFQQVAKRISQFAEFIK